LDSDRLKSGTVTFLPQPETRNHGSFACRRKKALINRLGFNNEGAEVVAQRLKNIDIKERVVGVNIGRKQRGS